MWYYIVTDHICIGMFNSVEDVNHFLARKGYTVTDIKQVRENDTIVEVEKW